MTSLHTFSSISQTEDGVRLFEEENGIEEGDRVHLTEDGREYLTEDDRVHLTEDDRVHLTEDNNGEELQPTAINLQLFNMLIEHEEEITASLELNTIRSASQLQTALVDIIKEKNLVQGESLVMITASILADTIGRIQVIKRNGNEI